MDAPGRREHQPGPGEGVSDIDVGPLAIGASASFNLVARVTAVGTLTNPVSITGTVPDADTTNNTAQTIVTAVNVPMITIADAGNGEADGRTRPGKPSSGTPVMFPRR